LWWSRLGLHRGELYARYGCLFWWVQIGQSQEAEKAG
jgi:hypothetical protein